PNPSRSRSGPRLTSRSRRPSRRSKPLAPGIALRWPGSEDVSAQWNGELKTAPHERRPGRPERSSGRSSRRPLRLQQAKNICADLGRVAIAFLRPVTVDLPAGAGRFVTVIRAPPADRLMGRVEPVVGTEVRRCGDRAGRGAGADNLAMPGERSRQLD